MAIAPVRRLSKEDRFAQLLDVAAELVLAQGIGAVTMERLAERAGVSKALVYLHFANAEAVLVDLYRREIERLGTAVMMAIDGTHGVTPQVRAAVAAYLDVVSDHGAIFGVLGAAGSTIAAQADDGARVGHRFVAGIFERLFGVRPKPATVAAAIFLGSLNGGVESWVAGEIERAEVEEALIGVALDLGQHRPGR